MIGPYFLQGALVERFREHLLAYPYAHLVHRGKPCDQAAASRFSEERAEHAVNGFVGSSFPLVCSAGGKSSVPFWDYHIALRKGEDEREAWVYELLVGEPIPVNRIKGIQMAYYVLVNDRYSIDRIVIPLALPDLADFEDVSVQIDPVRQVTVLSRKAGI